MIRPLRGDLASVLEIVGDGGQPVARRIGGHRWPGDFFGVVALRGLEQVEDVGLFHLAALVLNHHAIGGLRHHAHVVGIMIRPMPFWA